MASMGAFHDKESRPNYIEKGHEERFVGLRLIRRLRAIHRMLQATLYDQSALVV
jgi:hypothetical protein